jgi:hypothetical protein
MQRAPREAQRQNTEDTMPYVVDDADFNEIMEKMEHNEGMIEMALRFSVAAGAVMFALFVLEAVAKSIQVFRYFYPVTFKRMCIPMPREVDTENPPPASSSKEAGVWMGLP